MREIIKKEAIHIVYLLLHPLVTNVKRNVLSQKRSDKPSVRTRAWERVWREACFIRRISVVSDAIQTIDNEA